MLEPKSFGKVWHTAHKHSPICHLEIYNSTLMHSCPSFQYSPKIRHCTFINISFHRINFQFSHVPICDFAIWRFICESEMNSFHVMEKFFWLCPFIWSELPFLPRCDDADHSIPAAITDAVCQHTLIVSERVEELGNSPCIVTELAQRIHTVDDKVSDQLLSSCCSFRSICA